MEVLGKEIKDECQYCGEILNCHLFREGHGLGVERKNVSEMMRCQKKHKGKRTDGSR